jgi:hypothetical protein
MHVFQIIKINQDQGISRAFELCFSLSNLFNWLVLLASGVPLDRGSIVSRGLERLYPIIFFKEVMKC